jgi:hypothetical protein
MRTYNDFKYSTLEALPLFWVLKRRQPFWIMKFYEKVKFMKTSKVFEMKAKIFSI